MRILFCHHTSSWGGVAAALWRCLLVGVVGSVVLGLRPVRAQAPAADSIQIRALGPDRIEARPGQTITLRFRIENQSDTAYTVEPTLDLPRRWRALSAVSPVSLGSGGNALQLISVSVPPGAPAGDESLLFRGTVAGRPALRDGATVTARVPPVQEARLKVVEVPRQVPAGTSYEAIFSLTNEGNEAVRVDLEAKSNRARPVRVRPRTDSLAPQETRRIQVTVKTEAVSEAFKHRLRLRARLHPWGTALTERTRVEVLPRGGEGTTLFSGPTYPGTLRLEGFGQAGEQSGQVTFDGSGDLTADGSRSLDVLLRTPGQSQTARFGRRSAYRATYSTPAWTLRAGDHTFQRTRLSSRGRRGLGAEARYTGEHWRAGAYGFRTRFGEPIRQGAAYAQYALHPRARIGANVLRNDGAVESGTLGTLQGMFVPWDDAEFALEGGLGRSEQGRGGAYSVTLQGGPSWGRYRAQRLRVDEAFPGAFNDRRRTSASALARPTDWLSINGNVRRSVRDRIDDESFVSNAARAGLQVRGGGKTTTWSLRADGSIQRRPLRDGEAVQVQGRLRTGPIAVRPSVEVGRTRGAGETGRSFRTYGLDASVRLGAQQFDGRVERTDAPFSEGFTRRSRLRAAFSSRTRIGDRTSVILRGTLRNPGNGRAVTRGLQGRARHRLPFGHTIDAEARYRTGQDRGPRVRLAYTVPVSLPTPALSSDRATLSGRVVDAETNAPISGVRVRLGAAQRLTDNQGRFSAPIPDESALLRLASLGPGRVPMVDTPVRIRPGDAASDVVIPIRDAARLRVRVIDYEYPTARAALEGKDPEPTGGIVGELVEASRNDNPLRRPTGAGGQATFRALRPGTWTISLAGTRIPSDKAPAQSTYEVDLDPGTDTTVTVRVLPDERPEIKMIGEGRTLKTDSAPGPASDTTADTTTDTSPSAAGTGPFAVQVGAFAKWTNALQRARRLRAEEMSIILQQDTTGAVHRVLVGRFPSPQAAEQHLDRFTAYAPEAFVPALPDSTLRAVQVGAFPKRADALARARQIQEAGSPAVLQYRPRRNGLAYRVWAGPYASPQAAAQDLEALRRHAPEASVTRLPWQRP